ncbi:hypothetical protein [Caulobacter sp. X]|uniref:hypothetical protein n=1 Tax=Caulobacter sp. X TaxID=2048901 RepID=UPI000C149FE6|nr:hypothetical protein [Caulobacter sp. X]PIB96629.1 hypothetical protein CSW60_19210 [Caulobacter sp. X]
MPPRALPIVAWLLVAGLTGCAHEKVAATGYRWSYLADAGEDPRLAYGRPNSDDVVLMMRCRPDAGEIDLSAVGLSGGELVLTSGRSESRFAAAKVDDAMSEGLMEARGSASAPAFQAFRKSGDLTVLAKGQRHSLAADSKDRADVRAFFKACGA